MKNDNEPFVHVVMTQGENVESGWIPKYVAQLNAKVRAPGLEGIWIITEVGDVELTNGQIAAHVPDVQYMEYIAVSKTADEWVKDWCENDGKPKSK